ncbi:MAG: hypothetical protein IJF73_02400 [Clostridia bacterium]|nr:hypothetical protein [Clostridia bacterium]
MEPMKEKTNPLKEKLIGYVDILQGLVEGIDATTGEVIEGLSRDLRRRLWEMSLYFEGRLKAQERLESHYPNNGSRWSPEEDEAITAEYKAGRSIKELSILHERTEGAIRSRLLRLGIKI